MRFEAALRGNFSEIVEAEHNNVRRAVTVAMRRVTASMKRALRKQVVSAGLGKRLANTVRSAVYPKGTISLNPAGEMFWRYVVLPMGNPGLPASHSIYFYFS